jgi:hypothetical protein
MNKPGRIFFILLSFPTLILASFILYRVNHAARHPGEEVRNANFSMRERSMRAFEERTKQQWGENAINTADIDSIRRLAASQKDTSTGDGVVFYLSKMQRALLDTTIAEFLNTYNENTFSSILAFHSRTPYKIDLDSFDNRNFRAELEREGIPFPNAPEDRLKACWTLFQHFKFRTDFWNRYKAEQLKKGLVPDPNSKKALQQYLEDVKAHRSEYVPLKLTAISSNLFEITVFTAKPDQEFYKKIIQLNRNHYPGTQVGRRTVFLHKEGLTDIIAHKHQWVIAVLETAIQTNETDAFVPVTIVFYWIPNSQAWLPDYLVRHAYGSFQVLF